MITSYLTKNFYINTIIVIIVFILDRFSKIYVINLDKVNYSSNFYNTKEFKQNKKYKFLKCDIQNKKKITQILKNSKILKRKVVLKN